MRRQAGVIPLERRFFNEEKNVVVAARIELAYTLLGLPVYKTEALGPLSYATGLFLYSLVLLGSPYFLHHFLTALSVTP